MAAHPISGTLVSRALKGTTAAAPWLPLVHVPACRRVADMFQSVQLNVNNPHFLIMQGRVTKVRSACAWKCMLLCWWEHALRVGAAHAAVA